MDHGIPDGSQKGNDWVSYRRCRRRERVEAGGDQANGNGTREPGTGTGQQGPGVVTGPITEGFRGLRRAGTGRRRVRLHPMPYPNPAGSLNRNITSPLPLSTRVITLSSSQLDVCPTHGSRSSPNPTRCDETGNISFRHYYLLCRPPSS